LSRSLAVSAVTVIALLLGTTASSAAVIAPYNGENPFRCQEQNAGLGVIFPNPQADPFCVRYDKTQQNLTQLGMVDFLLNEPVRVAAVLPKCFYHQSDHWTAWVIQDTQPEIWNWDGSYFIDRARGMAGAYITNLRIGGEPADPRSIPGFPAEYFPFFMPGGGGIMTDTVASVPECAARVDTPSEVNKIYRQGWRYPE